MIEWVSGAPPVDEPPCGYRGERCIPAKTYTIEITGGVIGGLALVILVVALFVYRYGTYDIYGIVFIAVNYVYYKT